MAKKPAIQMTNGVDDIIKIGFKAAKDIFKTQRGFGKSVVKSAKATSKVARQRVLHETHFGSKGVYKGYKGGPRP
ncbi:hypothetical protein UFOVP928_11 [uncultured Caudovirales phage]|uniref:Uncharacterized protein n=1 Tax=uncultured Caudovirales phage TaxID=2100421 RepID=A0A6J5PKP0_9CAUD|nr:hypothetical protein UFOVP578_37 [uncultured Caudovirales phage]CAB4171672.1 hypothetical protein UFOVP928_11 [uncultured Caudovirales phage]CAB4183749.1 hypothetical protein UFOVP1098_5 [uncultured Caudovirales phage]CAB4200238.1 hypothetical protein UFOVP1353_28 [uncultured Caudovirales phage]CAB4214493.1 hypothetical protein UFOVP1458_40 [uncultured Caudovirales phage]